MSSHSDTFAEALDGTASGLLDDTEMMLVIVDRLRELPSSPELAQGAARPAFRTELRARLLGEATRAQDGTVDRGADVVPITSRWTQSWARRNRARIASGIAAGIVALTAVSVGAANSLPGNPLYQLKRGTESVQYALAGSDEQRGKLELGFARTRLHEIDRLTRHNAAFGLSPTTAPQAAGGSAVLAESASSKVLHLFADMDAEARKGSLLLTRSYEKNPRPGPMLAVQQFAREQARALTSLRTRLAGPALSRATHSLAWARLAVKTTTAVLATCHPACSSTSAQTMAPVLSPSLAPSVGPSAPGSEQPGPASAPGAPTTSPAPGQQPVAPVRTTPGTPPTVVVTPGQPTTTPTGGQPTQQTPTDTPTSTPTDSRPTTDPPSQTPTDTPPSTTPTDPPPTTTQEQPPASPTTDPVTVPPPSAPVTGPPAASSTPPAPSLTPAPSTQQPPASSAPTSEAGKPLICLPPSYIVNGVCIQLPVPPGTGAAVR